MTAFAIGFVVSVLAYWQGRCGGWGKCARHYDATLRERDRQHHEFTRERDRLWNAEIWARDRRIAELQREIDRLTGTMRGAQLAAGTFSLTNADGETRIFSGSLDNPQQQAAALRAMRQPPNQNSD